ncbi:MAG: type IV pilus secretin PilQ [Pseudomonadota bacterium]
MNSSKKFRANETRISAKAGRGVLAAVAGLLILFSGSSVSSEISGANWAESDASSSTLSLNIDDHPEYQIQRESENQITVLLKNTSMSGGNRIRQIPARGIVRGGQIVPRGGNILVSMNLASSGRATVTPTSRGYDVIVGTSGSTQTPTAAQPSTPRPAATPAQSESPAQPIGKTEVTGLTFSRISGDRVQINLVANGAIPEPAVFRTVDPPRIAMDFAGLTNRSGKQVHRVRLSSVDSVVIAEDDRRLRLVLNLLSPADYVLKRSETGAVLTVGNNIASSDDGTSTAAASTVQTSSASQSQTAASSTADSGDPSITSIDFRRTAAGAGRIIVKLNNSGTAVDMKEQGGEIIAEFPNTALPDDLEQRLDVVDFATPVSTIDSYSDGSDVKLVITPVGRYKQSSVQSGSSLIIDIAPLTKAEEEAEKTDEFGYSGEKLSLNFQRISVRAALQVIADFTGLNFVTSDAISGDLSLRLKDVPWDQALDVILQTKGLAMRQKGNVVWVAPAEEILAKEKQALEAKQEVGEIEPLVSELIKINYAKAEAVADILKSVKAVETGINQQAFSTVSVSEIKTEENNLLSSRGSVTVDNRTNSLLIQDTASKLREIRELIAKLDIPVRQVQIETRIVQANDDFSKNIGARLGFTQVTQQARFPGASDSNIGDVFGSGSIENTNRVRTDGLTEVNDDALSVNLPAGAINGDSAAQYAFTLAKLGSGFLSLLDLEISALQAEGKGRILANPKILTTDKRQASIEQGEERTEIVAGGLTGATTGTQKAVLNLTVTPQITPDDKITLDVEITNDSFIDASNGLISTKRISTQTLLENGETVVIGGIYTQDQATGVSKVPLLGDIPLLGRLFRRNTARDNRTELLVFLTPRIIDPALTVN